MNAASSGLPNGRKRDPPIRVPQTQSAFCQRSTTKRFPSPRCASAIQIVRHSESMAETQPKLQPASWRLSAMISQYFTLACTALIWSGFANHRLLHISGTTLKDKVVVNLIIPRGAPTFDIFTRQKEQVTAGTRIQRRRVSYMQKCLLNHTALMFCGVESNSVFNYQPRVSRECYGLLHGLHDGGELCIFRVLYFR
jgi:hypothetical protein